ncbi:MAG: hypothetical protein ACREJ9_07785 [Candidatus Rokuibacteriota bacterium]
MTITEKILADHAGQREVHPGELVDCRLAMLMGNDITAPIAIMSFADSHLLIRNLSKNETYHATPLPDFAREIMAAGGLMKYVAKKKGLRPR